MSNDNSSENDSGQSPDDLVRRRIEEIAEQYLRNLREGGNDLEELVGNHPELEPFLRKRLHVVQSLFRLSNENNGTEPTTSIDQHPESEQGKRESDRLKQFMDYALRLNCPNCGIRIQIVDSRRNNEVTCDGCGSTIQIDPNRTRTAAVEDHPSQIGKFSIVGLLGRGGFGSVFKADDPDLARTVAIKIPRTGSFDSRQEKARFIREARYAGKLRHPGIVTVLDVAEDNNVPYIVSEFIDGITLEDLISSRRIGFRHAGELIVNIANAIQFAHEQAVIHRDIKPSNVLLDDQGNPHIADFGLAIDTKDEFTLTITGQVLGTPSYMSPEQAAGESGNVDARSDVYSLGVVLYRMLSGELPFRGSKRMLLYQVIHDDPKPLNKLNDYIPRELDVITQKAMAKDPGHRYATARELSEDIGRWLRNEPILAKPDAWNRRFQKWCIRKPMIAALSFGVLMLCVACAVIAIAWAIQVTSLNQVVKKNLDRVVEKEIESSSRLRLLYLSNARRLIDKGDAISSLPWFASAIPEGANANDPLRLQIGRIVDEIPKLTGFWNAGENVRQASYSSDGSRILALNNNNEIKVFCVDRAANSAAKTFQHQEHVLSVELSPNGDFLAAIVGKNVVIWDTTTETTKAVLSHDDLVIAASFDSKGNKLGSASIDGVAKIWKTTDWDMLHQCELVDQEIKHAVFLPDGQEYLTVSIDPAFTISSLVLWDVETGEKNLKLVQSGQISTIGFDSASKRLAAANTDGSVVIWNRKDGKQEGILNHGGVVGQLFFENDDETIVTVTRDGLVTRWESNNFARLDDPFELSSPVIDSDISDDSTIFASADSEGRIRLFWLGQQTQVCSSLPHGTSVSVIDFHPNGRQFIGAGNDGAIKQWDLAGVAPAGPLIIHDDVVLQARFSANGKLLVSSSYDATGRLSSTDSGTRIGNPLQHDKAVLDCDISCDGLRIVTGSGDRNAQVWSAITSAPIGPRLEHLDAVTRVAFSPNPDIFVTGTLNGKIFVWKVGSKTPLFQFDQSHEILSIAFPASGTLFATASNDGTVRIRDWNDGSSIESELEHKQPVTYCSFDREGELLATASRSGKVTIWSIRDLTKPMQVLGLADDATSCNFSYEGNRIVTTDLQGGVQIWQKENGKFETEQQLELGKYSMMFAEFSQDGKFVIASGGQTEIPTEKPRIGEAFLIDVELGIPIGVQLRHFGQIYRSRFDAASGQIVTASLDNSARIWPLRYEEMKLDKLAEFAELLSGQGINARQQFLPLSAGEQQSIFEQLSSSNHDRFSVSQTEIDSWNQFKEWLNSRFKATNIDDD